MQIQDALTRYLVQLDADGRSIHTRNQYQRHVKLLAKWLDDTDVDRIEHDTLAVFLPTPVARLRSDGKKKSAVTMNSLRSSLRTFFAYLHAAGETRSNPARLIRRAICSGPLPRSLSEDEQTRLLGVLAKAPDRDRVLFTVMLRTGIRLGSALALEVDDVDLDRGELRLRGAKGNREQVVFFPPALRSDLEDVMDEGRLFAISGRHACRRFRAYSKAAAIRARGTHALRHTFAMAVYSQTGDLLLTKEALGHRSVASTVVYARCSRNRLRAALSG